MPIEVHCPNPNCARVHLVKSKYGGMRGKCPACSSWMYIPVSQQPSTIMPRPAALDESPAWAAQEARQTAGKPEPARQSVAAAVSRQPVREEPEEAALLPEEPAPLRPWSEPAVEEEEPLALVEEAEKAPKKHFSRLAVVFLLLGILSLGAVSAAPFLPGPGLEATGDLAQLLAKPKGIDEDYVPYVIGAPGVVAFLALLSLALGLAGKRFGFLNLLLLYLAVPAGAVVLMCGLEWFHREAKDAGEVQKRIDRLKEQGTSGDATVSPGLQFAAMAGGAAAACLFFILAALFMHRRWWARMLTFCLLAVWPVLVSVWVYRKELGIDTDFIPFEMPF